jgi:hypothetical protein
MAGRHEVAAHLERGARRGVQQVDRIQVGGRHRRLAERVARARVEHALGDRADEAAAHGAGRVVAALEECDLAVHAVVDDHERAHYERVALGGHRQRASVVGVGGQGSVGGIHAPILALARDRGECRRGGVGVSAVVGGRAAAGRVHS